MSNDSVVIINKYRSDL